MGKYNRDASTNLIYILCDCGFCVIAFFIAWLVNQGEIQGDLHRYEIVAMIFMLIYAITSKETRLYNVTTFFYADRIIRYITKAFLVASGATLILLFYVGNSHMDQKFYIMFLIFSYIGFLMSTFLTRKFIKQLSELAPRTLLVGGREHYHKFQSYLYKSNQNANVVGYVSYKESDRGKEGYIGHIDELEQLLHQNMIDQVFIMQRKSMKTDELQHYITICMELGVTVRLIMDSYRVGNAQCYVSSVGTYPIITYHTVTLNPSSKFVKRVIDVVGSIIGIILSSPIMLITAIAIKLDSKGPVLFQQERVGMNGRHFKILKFRSMCPDAEQKKAELMGQNEMGDALMFKMRDDPRITRVGKFIRKTSIDELPQFFNVLKGDMSLVGTRPPTVDEVTKYERMHWRRISIKPGITGMWQVSGRSSITDFDEIVQLDKKYIDEWSVLLDLEIMMKTVLQVLARKDAY